MAISCVILAGGRATRMQGADKGLVMFNAQPLVAHVIAQVQPQVDEIILNANRELTTYQQFGYAVVPDVCANFLGPLAGIQVGLRHATHDYLLTVPCDTPYFPQDLVSRLYAALTQQAADIAVANSDGVLHPVISLCRKSVLGSLDDFIAKGGRKVRDWQASLHVTTEDFSDHALSCKRVFHNLNTFEDMAHLTAQELNPVR